MAPCIEGTLISPEDPCEATVSSSVSPATTKAGPGKIGDDCPRHDSFSGLADMMRAKQSYTPSVSSSRRLNRNLANGTHSARTASSSSSILSPLARPYFAGGSIAAHLHDRSHSPGLRSPTADYNQQNMQRLDSVLKELEDLTIEDDDNTICPAMQQQSYPIQCPPPGLGLPTARPVFTGQLSPPPTPAISARPPPPEEPVVRLTMPVYDSMCNDVKTLKQEKRNLEAKLAQFDGQVKPGCDNNHAELIQLQTEIGRLEYQNDANKKQKANMARSLSEKDTQIKELQLKLDDVDERLKVALTEADKYAKLVEERNYLQSELKEARLDNSRESSALADSKAVEIQELAGQVEELQRALHHAQAVNSQAEDYRRLAQDRLDQIVRQEKMIKTAKEKYGIEHEKSSSLEAEVGDLRQKLSQVDSLQYQLNEKTRLCDSYRTKLRTQDLAFEHLNQKLSNASDVNRVLQGAAHLVIPNPTGSLPKQVMACTECYNKNLTCDDRSSQA
ncbi:hypothetical protein E8E13_008356 [Curvularia kusanoi]|uniref:Uncharacterized protein n=1 Tax=Curvularia kusanoi TaxID=90978 RepID=A0A9P4TFU8_CURKU|nr:hypothetical protein E8E13_008356 [Curvularia kusanoi]